MDIKQILKRCEPIWSAKQIYAESLTFVRDESGSAEAPLMFAPERVVRVTDACEENEYTEGVDYEVTATGLRLLPGTRIFAFTREELEPSDPVPGSYFPAADRNIFFREGRFFHDRQVSVTYDPVQSDWDGPVPSGAFGRLPRTRDLLENKKKLRLLIYGDSISVGANASGFTDSWAPPYQPPYPGLLKAVLEHRFGAEIELINTSKGGAGSAWARENAADLAAAHAPDLALVAFGGNDSPTPPDVFGDNIAAVAQTIRAAAPECEFIFSASTVPNPLLCTEKALFCGNQPLFAPVLYDLADRLGGAAVADITAMHRYVSSRKRFIDMTGNNVNHPNDFFHRLHAMYYSEMFR